LEGYDKSSNKFMVKIKPDEIDDNWKFECELVPDLLRDKSANMNLATQAVREMLLSRQTARDEFSLVTDTDLEEEKIAKEQARAVLDIGALEAITALVKDYSESPDPVKQFILNHALVKLAQLKQQAVPQNGGNGSMPANQNTGNLNARNAQPNIPLAVRQEALRRVQGQ